MTTPTAEASVACRFARAAALDGVVVCRASQSSTPSTRASSTITAPR